MLQNSESNNNGIKATTLGFISKVMITMLANNSYKSIFTLQELFLYATYDLFVLRILSIHLNFIKISQDNLA